MQARDRLLVAHVQHLRMDPAAILSQRLDGFGDVFGRAARHVDLGAVVQQLPAETEADSGRGARDNGDFAVEEIAVLVHRSSPPLTGAVRSAGARRRSWTGPSGR